MDKPGKKNIEEASQDVGVPCDVIIEFIEHSWVGPIVPQEPFLDEEDLARVRLIWELREEMGVNDEAIPIILHLIDQLNRFHYELSRRD